VTDPIRPGNGSNGSSRKWRFVVASAAANRRNIQTPGGSLFSHRLPVLPFRILAVFLLAAAVTGCAGLRPVFRQSGPSVDAQTRAWQKKILRKGQDGDWLIIRGYSSTGDLVAAAGNTEFSHVGILDASHGEIIEAVSPEVCALSLQSFLEEADRVVLIRPTGATWVSGREALAKARSQIGAPYDLPGTMGLPEAGKFYCSELAAWSVGMEVDREGTSEILHPAAMLEFGVVLFDSASRSGKWLGGD
jgi:hypothetical protein